MTDHLYAGIDLGGTKIRTLIVDAAGKVLGDTRTPTLASQGPDAVIARMADTVREAAREAGLPLDQVRCAGVSAPGPMDMRAGTLTDPPNLPGWHNVPLARLLGGVLGIPTIVENDANCSAVGEHRFGAGRGFDDMIYITVSTGIGGGLIIGGKLYAGASGAAGEVGHIGVAASGPACGAGHPGCLEAFSSGAGIAARAAEAIAEGRLPRTARLAERNPPLSTEEVHQAGQEGEQEAAAIIENAGRYLGIGLASIINAFNPQVIVLGGGLINIGEALLGPAIDTARARSFAQSFADVRIVEWELGEEGAALGAIAVARDRLPDATS